MTELDMKDLTFFKPERGMKLEQTFLTYNAATGSWDLEHYGTGEDLDLDAFSIGTTHWFDLTDVDPDGVADRKQMRQEMFEEGGE